MKGQTRPWNAFDEEVLRQLHANGWGLCDIASFMACAKKTIHARGAALGLSWGSDGRFKPGQVPANKGLRRPGWAPGRMACTQFKPGRPAHEARNYQPIGSERISKDGYPERKVSDDLSVYPARRWVAVHRLVWEAANGPIPPGHAVVFSHGQKTAVAAEISLERLELVTRAELMHRNSRHTNYPPELNRLIQLKGALNRKINRRSKAA